MCGEYLRQQVTNFDIEAPREFELASANILKHFNSRGSLEGCLARDQLADENSKGPDIDSLVLCVANKDLGRHVDGSAARGVSLGARPQHF